MRAWAAVAVLGGLAFALTFLPARKKSDATPNAAAIANRAKNTTEGSLSHTAHVQLFESAEEAVRGADVIATDVWTSMGQEKESAERKRLLMPYQVNAQLIAHAAKNAIVLHCLPAHRGEEITDDVVDGPQSVVFDEAENRMHAQKALLEILIQTK